MFICPFCSEKEKKSVRVEGIQPGKVIEHLIVVKMDLGNGDIVFHVHGPVSKTSEILELIQFAAKEAAIETRIED